MYRYLLLIPLLAGCAKNYDNINFGNGSSTVYTYDWNLIADTSTAAFIANYWNASASYFNANNQGSTTFGYWPQAHGLDIMVDAYMRTDSSAYTNLMSEWYTGVQSANGNTFIGQYYDDMGWNALAMLRTYDVTKDVRWKTAAQTVWTNIQGGWNNIEGGGIAWQKQETYFKNTPANGPACILAARLYEQFGNPSDLTWAQNIYNWEKSTLVDPGTGFVYDGINGNNDGKLNTTWFFTYNQGLFIGAALEMYNATGQPSYLSDALLTANNAITDPRIVSSGLFHDEGQGDGGLFKGVLVRYLTQLTLSPALDQNSKSRFVLFLKNNAQSLWLKATTRPGYFYGSNWSVAPSGETDLTTEESGVMLFEAMALLHNNKLL
ncbi:glycoside hydrolase family 76 protein [Dinghuibacter silviterrae]|uniref:Putative alpha-1,6-mannanase (GH76 family) n=1 Tax=Dinghuibacter silviterrae TaxID=1539049 RepID=A0A4R8DST4_9BACT|nr:glycoside hydrolase family 76 protein [Dinghuibacter silviterrae]TDX01332.1 putative alpha-1,6-mannanase (GH76 family) [Dinghuibacter silviterrae]